MDHQHLKSGSLCQSGHISVSFHDLIDQFFGQCFHLHAIRTHRVGRSPLIHGMLTVFICHIRSRIHAGMGQFQTGDGSMAADRIGSIGSRGQ